MDYRKPAVFGENWSNSRYKVLPYFAAEKALMQRPGVGTILDLGCASGWNMSRFSQYGKASIGLDVVPERVKLALTHGPVTIASGLDVPLAAESCDIVYIQHVLHHIGDVDRALKEVHRLLKPGGHLFLVETTEDNPIIRWGRRLYPKWLGDEINAPFYFDQLQDDLRKAGFETEQAQQYSVLFWIWEILPDRWPWFEKLTPAAVWVERLIVSFFRPWSAHCFLVVRKSA